MAKERSRRCVLLGVCALLCVVCVCLHVYVELTWWGGQGSATRLHQAVTAPTRKRRVSEDAHTWRKNASLSAANTVGSTCCPPQRRSRSGRRWRIELQPWAGERHSLEEEAKRFLRYISTPQIQCSRSMLDAEEHWNVCEDDRFSLARRVTNKHCRVYSLGLGADERQVERALVRAACEVHCFDPSISEPHLQESERLWVHRLSVDWRDPNPAISGQRHHGNTKKLATILNEFGHQEVDVLKVDMESAEWKILENLVLEGVLSSVGQLLLEVHLHWAGFEVGGEDSDVVRYWFSLLKEVELAHFSLFHSWSDPNKPRLFLHRNLWNTSSAFRLGWVNTRWKPR
ncbi:putative methyltransferase-like protein 24 [Alosa pseudoharengus]|uniref:putative methyltransferase-like protein 24 n=1 Tax=Alosa pseudoharengus TaxID=34774 RepID=UPI003F89A0EC